VRISTHRVRALATILAVLAAAPYAAAQTMDFTTRCAQPGVVKCVSFDTDADFSQGVGGTQGAWGSPEGVIPPSGTSDYTRAIRDTTVAADGTSSLRFTIGSNTPADVAGSWFTDFTSDQSFQVGEGQDVYIQWRQRFSPEYLTTMYAGVGGGLANGWKLADVGPGDTAACAPATASSLTCSTSCDDFDTVVQDTGQHGLPQIYANCSGPYPYNGLYGSAGGITVQNGVGCLYPNYPIPPCVTFYPNEWMTFQIHIKVGHWGQWDSTIQFWVARDGQPSQLVIDCSPTAVNPCNYGGAVPGWYLYNSNPATEKFGKVWLTPYHTNKSASQTTPVAYTWYDDLIISKQMIPDPTPGVKPDSPTGVAVH
jgi:hypothetical protein